MAGSVRVPTPVCISCTNQRVSPVNSRSHRLLLLNFIITPLLSPAPGPHQPGLIASKVGEPGGPRMPLPLDLLSSAMSSLIGTSSRPTSPAPDHHHPDLYGGSPLDRNDRRGGEIDVCNMQANTSSATASQSPSPCPSATAPDSSDDKELGAWIYKNWHRLKRLEQ